MGPEIYPKIFALVVAGGRMESIRSSAEFIETNDACVDADTARRIARMMPGDEISFGGVAAAPLFVLRRLE